MTALALAALLAVSCQSGWMSQYSEAATERVIATRSVPGRTAWDMPQDWRQYDGLLAVESCDRLGEVVTVYWRGHHATMLIFDCSGHDSTSAWMKRNNIIGEVDGWTAKRWNSIGRGMKKAIMCKEIK